MRFETHPLPVEDQEVQAREHGPRTVPFGQDRLGNNAEGATLITAGRFAGYVAVLDGYDVIAVPVEGQSALAPTKLFGIEPLAPVANPSGIAYARSERHFFFDLQGQWDTLWVTDENGNPVGPRPITFLPGFDPASIVSAEGMTYLPPGSSSPDRLARALYIATSEEAYAQIEFLTLQGVVEREIRLGAPLSGPEVYVLGITWLPSDAFLISLDDGNLWTIGMDGTVLSGPVQVPDVPMAESLIRLNDGRIMVATYTSGRLLALDAKLTRAPDGDRTFSIGPGLTRVFDGVWDAESSRYLLLGIDRNFADVLGSVPPSRDSFQMLFNLSGPCIGVAALPDEKAFALGHAFPPFGIDIVGRDGVLREQIMLANVAGLPNRRTIAITYIPTTRQFAVLLRREPNRLWLISRGSMLDGSFPIAPRYGVLQYVSEGGQDRLHIWAPPTLHKLDLAGNSIATMNISLTGLVNPGGYVAGPNGQFLLLDPHNSEAVLRSQ